MGAFNVGFVTFLVHLMIWTLLLSPVVAVCASPRRLEPVFLDLLVAS